MPSLSRPQGRPLRTGSPRRVERTVTTGGRVPEEPGGVRGVNLVIIVLVILAVAGAALLLARTVNIAQRIDKKAQHIATSGRGINISTDSIVQLNRTNKIAGSILVSAKPLKGKLTSVVGTARSIRGYATAIDGKATTINNVAGTINTSATTIGSSANSINGSASQINSSAKTINGTAGDISGSAKAINGLAGTINGTARGINSTAGAIVSIAKLIDRDANSINRNLDTTIAVARSIKVDTGNILGQAGSALDTAACIDKKLAGGNGDPADCKGKP